jgi:hypothetical protein
LPGRFSTSGISNRSGKSQQDGEEEDSDEDHAQDWSKETKDEESWANRERRRSSVWSKTDHNTPFANTDNAGRRGSILSLWSAGKDKDGKHILKHDDHEVKNDDESAISDGLASPNGSRSGSLSIPGSRRGTNDRSNSKGADRRPSILGMWSTGKDEEGNVVMLHDDEEWKK